MKITLYASLNFEANSLKEGKQKLQEAIELVSKTFATEQNPEVIELVKVLESIRLAQPRRI